MMLATKQAMIIVSGNIKKEQNAANPAADKLGNALRAIKLFEQKDFRKLRMLGDGWPELEGKVKEGIQALRVWALNIARDIIQRDIQDLDNHKEEVGQIKHRRKEHYQKAKKNQARHYRNHWGN